MYIVLAVSQLNMTFFKTKGMKRVVNINYIKHAQTDPLCLAITKMKIFFSQNKNFKVIIWMNEHRIFISHQWELQLITLLFNKNHRCGYWIDLRHSVYFSFRADFHTVFFLPSQRSIYPLLVFHSMVQVPTSL